MDRSNLDTYYRENVGLIHRVARKGHQRLVAIGASDDYMEVFQMLSEVFIITYDMFDETAGTKFSTYYTLSAYRALNKHAESIETERIQMGVRSIEEMNDWNEDDDAHIEETIPSGYATPCQIAEANSSLAQAKRMSALAQRLLELTLNPPECIEREFLAAQSHAKLVRDRGGNKRAGHSLNLLFVAQLVAKTTSIEPSAIKNARVEVESFIRREFQ